MFDPRLIRYHRSAEWSSPDQIAKYLVCWLHKPLDKEVQNRLSAKCPRHTVAHKINNTPDFDSFMYAYMNKQGSDPRKGTEKELRDTQDKLLDVSGPLTQAMVVVDNTITRYTPLDRYLVRDWL